MNHYPHHIGDFNVATRHLTRVERSLYRDAIELYYDKEKPLSDDFDRLSRRLLANSEEEKSALKFVLSEFFELVDGVYIHDRCEEEILKFQNSTSAKARAGKASAEAKKKRAEERRLKKATESKQNSTDVEQTLNENQTDLQQNSTNLEPRTKNLEPKTSKKKRAKKPPPDFSTVKNLNISAWNRWTTYRREIHGKKPYKTLGTANKLAAYSYDIQNKAVDYSIYKEWMDVFPENVVQEKKRAASRSLKGQARLDRCHELGISTHGKEYEELYEKLAIAEDSSSKINSSEDPES